MILRLRARPRFGEPIRVTRVEGRRAYGGGFAGKRAAAASASSCRRPGVEVSGTAFCAARGRGQLPLPLRCKLSRTGTLRKRVRPALLAASQSASHSADYPPAWTLATLWPRPFRSLNQAEVFFVVGTQGVARRRDGRERDAEREQARKPEGPGREGDSQDGPARAKRCPGLHARPEAAKRRKQEGPDRELRSGGGRDYDSRGGFRVAVRLCR